MTMQNVKLELNYFEIFPPEAPARPSGGDPPLAENCHFKL